MSLDPALKPQQYAFMNMNTNTNQDKESTNTGGRNQGSGVQSEGGDQKILVGDTVSVGGGSSISDPTSIGVVHFVGPVEYAKGDFAGVVMQDRTRGKNDGSVKGKRYFTCPKGRGLMVKLREVVKMD